MQFRKITTLRLISLWIFLGLACNTLTSTQPEITPSPVPTSTPVPTNTPDYTPTPVWTPVAPFSHEGNISRIRFSPDGQRIASASWDGRVRIWEVSTGSLVSQMEHGGQVSYVGFSPDGKRVVSDTEGGVVVWDALSGKEIIRKTIAGAMIFGAFSEDGSRIIIGSNDGFVSFMDAKSGKEVSRYSDISAGVNSIYVTPDEQWVAYASFGVGLYNMLTKKAYPLMQEEFPMIFTEVNVSLDGKWLAAGTSPQRGTSGYIFIWRVSDGKRVFMKKVGEVVDIHFSPDGELLAVASFYDAVYIINLSNLEVVTKISDPEMITAVAFSPDGKSIAIGYSNTAMFSEIKILNLR